MARRERLRAPKVEELREAAASTLQPGGVSYDTLAQVVSKWKWAAHSSSFELNICHRYKKLKTVKFDMKYSVMHSYKSL